MNSRNNIIKLSLCGVIYSCSKETLMKCEYFKNLFEEYSQIDFSKEELYIERSPVIFKHILSLLIDEKYPFPEKYKTELKYFLINDPISNSPFSGFFQHSNSENSKNSEKSKVSPKITKSECIRCRNVMFSNDSLSVSPLCDTCRSLGVLNKTIKLKKCSSCYKNHVDWNKTYCDACIMRSVGELPQPNVFPPTRMCPHALKVSQCHICRNTSGIFGDLDRF
jgi:hypothetical protein